MKSLYLDPVTWDLAVDSARGIAVASDPYVLAQNAASATRVFKGEAYYDTDIGITYNVSILGQNPPIEYVRSELIRVAKTVPGVTDARMFFTSFDERTLTGQLQVTDVTGNVQAFNI
jgi:hypothetical protein